MEVAQVVVVLLVSAVNTRPWQELVLTLSFAQCFS